jgi:hypothetical protein
VTLDNYRDLLEGAECPHCKNGSKRKFLKTDLMYPLSRERGIFLDDVKYPDKSEFGQNRGKQYPVKLYASCNRCKSVSPLEQVIPDVHAKAAVIMRLVA